MPRQLFDFDPPERFVAGTVGEPGSRTFFLQARGGGRTVSVALEKQQVAVLAERVEELLDDVLLRSGGSAAIPAVAPEDLDDADPLDAPISEDFRVGTMALEWDEDAQRIVITAQAVTEDDTSEGDDGGELIGPDDADGPDLLRVHLSGAAGRAFAKRSTAVVSAGRPACPFCGLPLDPAGHICPRQNGYRR